MKKLQKGFTLIELLVVIAIIGILSAVVLASLNAARSKGLAGSVQSQMVSLRSQAEIFYTTTGNNSYGTAGTTAGACLTAAASQIFRSGVSNSVNAILVSIRGDLTADTQMYCITNPSTGGGATSAWAVAVMNPSVSNQAFCIDNTGRTSVMTGASSSAAINTSIAQCL